MKSLLFVLLLPLMLLAQDYLWPTNASKYLTSSFCEFRPGHYHSAIDIKTWNQEGYPCYAVADAEISRVRVSPFGYGKVIYLKLSDGRTAVYAHLQKFNKKLDKAVREKQIKQERYTINWRPKNWPVKKGDIIGYTGQTGIGVPHLHFEIRDEQERPLNPLRFYDQVQDNIAPTLTSLLIIPQDQFSHINGTFAPKKMRLIRSGENNFTISEPMRASGKIGFALKGFDKADGVHNKFAFYKTELRINQKPIFQIQYDRMDFSTTGQIDLEIFYPLRATSRQIYHKLFIEPYNQLPFYNRQLGDGTIEVTDSLVPFEIDVYDYSGNRSTISGTIIPNGVEPASMRLMNRINNTAFIEMELPAVLEQLQFASSRNSKTWQAIDYFEVLDRSFTGKRQRILLKLALNHSNDQALKTSVTTGNDETITTQASLTPEKNQDVKFSLKNVGKYLLLHFKQLQDVPGLSLDILQNADTTRYQPRILNNSYEQVLPANIFKSDSLKLRLHNRKNIFIDTSLVFQRLVPKNHQSFTLIEDQCWLLSNINSVYDTLIFSSQQTASPKNNKRAALLSPAVHIHTSPQPMRKGTMLTLRYDPDNPHPERTGLYRFNAKGNLSLVGSNIDTSRNTVSGQIRSFGKFIAAADTILPEVKLLAPAAGSRIKGAPVIRFKAVDRLSGIGSDKNIRVTVDNRFVIPEWDPETDVITAKPHWIPAKGKHSIELSVTDKAGNTRKKSFNIHVY